MPSQEERDSDPGDVRGDGSIRFLVVNDEAESIRHQPVIERIVDLAERSPVEPGPDQGEIDIRARPIGALRARTEKKSTL